MRHFGGDDIDKVIQGGIVFKKAPAADAQNGKKVKTKAKKKAYATGSHGSGSAKMKADIRKRRAERHK